MTDPAHAAGYLSMFMEGALWSAAVVSHVHHS